MVESRCGHCGQSATNGWDFDDQARMVADGAWPPGACAWCWYSVAAAHLDTPCDTPAACTHRVRDLPEATDGG